jgi:hypothetical protein
MQNNHHHGNNNNNNNNNNDHHFAAVVERLPIQDLETWLLFNGLRNDDDDDNNGVNDLNRQEEIARFREHELYQQSIHEAAFQDSIEREKEKLAFLDTLQDISMDILTSDGVVENVSLRKLAERCEAILAFASSYDKFQKRQEKRVQFDLKHFPKQAVQEFVDVAVSNKEAGDIGTDSIIHCCQLAHYLLAFEVLREITDILMKSIDSNNCLSICQLADELHLDELFERSLAHMMDTMGNIQQDEQTWDELTPELRDRISAIKMAIESSIHSSSRGGSTAGSSRRLYFASLDEYLSIFAERVQYSKERLAEAKEQQNHAVKNTKGWIDAQTKIEKQEVRVRTLERALAEQKKLFGLQVQQERR